MNPMLALIGPLFHAGSSVILSWMLTFILIAAVVCFVIWLVTKLAGPPVIPEPFRWIVWALVIIALVIFIFAALGIGLP